MKLVRLWIFLAMTVLGLSQCNVTSTGGGDPTPDPNITKTELLAGKSSKAWVLTVSKINGNDVFNQTVACVRDNNMVFRTDKNYEWNEGATKCRTQDDQVFEKGTWAFNTAETELVLNNETNYKIVKLTENTLQVSYTNVFGETLEMTFKPN
ncbi:hypothetical protein FHS57_005442 [Runella defluvii]|uniref:Lipocalin-like domain-containing protein n=1 Tax=Runella defluvii TaxID=370973 RepID=A0A7W5ZTE6_9BACT|nr:lipocalin family protein [Runella defluvii]MBB3841414.1 hypothetical protein [Runella defluvii]